MGNRDLLNRYYTAFNAGDMDAYEPFPVLEIPPAAREQARARVAAVGNRVVGVQMGSQRTNAVWPLVPRPHLKALTEGLRKETGV